VKKCQKTAARRGGGDFSLTHTVDMETTALDAVFIYYKDRTHSTHKTKKVLKT